MKRGKNVFIICHCLLNSNAKIYPLADTRGVYTDDIAPLLSKGAGLVQLPCPETCYLGMNRWGMTREQYDHHAYRDFCKMILHPILLQITAFAGAGYRISGVAGMDGSPNCGITKTCIGYRGGEICFKSRNKLDSELKMVPGRGVFMEIFEELLKVEGIVPPFVSLHEEL
ncbi:MAG: CD3072 family TudS-related putative desulfidase [Desulforhopalus sp.]